MQKKRLLLLLLILPIISSCAGMLTLTGRVSTATYTEMPKGASFVVVGSNNLTLTERNIQTIIANHMIEKGFHRADNAESADIVAMYSYSIGAGTTSVSSRPDFVWGGQQVDSSTNYPRYFQITLVDLKISKLPDKIEIIWQGEIYSKGSGSNINYLAKDFVDELFNHLGQTVTNKTFIRALE